MKKKFDIKGMTCAACQAHVQKAVDSLDGITSCNVNLLSNNMEVEYNENVLSDERIIQAVSDAGYEAVLPNEKVIKTNEKDYTLAKLITSGILLLILMYFSMGNMMWGWISPSIFDHHHNPMGFSLLQFILVLPITYIYRNYFISGFKKLFKGHPNMDSLIALGATFSLIYGVVALFMISYGTQGMINDQENYNYYHDLVMTYHDSLYFESAGMILTLVSLGKYLEGLSKKKTTKALTKLMDLAPKKARVLIDNEEVIIPVEKVKVNDIIICKKGEAIPVDGIIIEGNASIDQANITGESLPIYKVVNDEVYSSTLISVGYIKIKATKVGEDTSIANIIKLVEEASNSKAPISKLADKVSGIFVPVILSIAVLTFIINMLLNAGFETSFNFAITVVVIACPCALGLATPLAIMVGTGKGAENGLLIKNAEILEKAHLIKTIVLDKTGTITEGKPSVTDYISLKENKDIYSILYSLENKSEHPLAKSIIDFVKEHNPHELQVKDFTSLDGQGLVGIIDDKKYYIGNLNYLVSNKINVSNVEERINELSSQGKTTLVILEDNEVIGIIAIKDKVKKNSILAIKELQNYGINVVMLTGDNKLVAEAIGKEVGVKRIISEVKPQDKLDVINSLKSDDKHLVAMVGDGVNDALALTSADLGIAVGGGSDVALESSDIILLRNDLLDILNVITLSRRTINTIKLGLFWAFFYNFICVIIATGAFYYINPSFKINPMIGSIAMSISSVSVCLNALTINFYKPKKIENVNYESSSSNEEVNVTKMEEKEMKELVIEVHGMMCAHCKKHVEDACLKVSGVSFAEASLENNNVVVKFEGEVSKEDLIKEIVSAGYEAK